MSGGFVQFADDLWVLRSPTLVYNAGVCVSDRSALLIDPGVRPDDIDEIRRLLTESGLEASLIVLTHSHWDHILGPECSPGVKTVAQRLFMNPDFGLGNGPRRARTLVQVMRWETEQGYSRPRQFEIPSPNLTFDEAMVLSRSTMGNRGWQAREVTHVHCLGSVGEPGRAELRLIHAPGHWPDELVVWQPDAGWLWAGDMLSDLEIPFVSHSIRACRATLAWLSRIDIQGVVPGHGNPTRTAAEARQRIQDDESYLAELEARVTAAVDRQLSLSDVLRLCEGMQFHHPTLNRGPHRLNVESVWAELAGSSPAGEPGWGRE